MNLKLDNFNLDLEKNTLGDKRAIESKPHNTTYSHAIGVARGVAPSIEMPPMKKSEVESRTQGSRPRPRKQKKIRGQGHKKNPRPRPRTAFPRTEPLEVKDRNARGQGQGLRTQPQVFSKKKVFKKVFQAISNS